MRLDQLTMMREKIVRSSANTAATTMWARWGASVQSVSKKRGKDEQIGG